MGVVYDFGMELPPLPGRWLQLHRTYTAFTGVPTPALCEWKVNMQATADRVVVLYVESHRFSYRDSRTGLIALEYDHCSLTLCGSDEAVGLAKAVAAGEATLGILADWVEDDPASRVKNATLPRHDRHRTSEDAVTHLLTVMRCHRPAPRRRKK